MIPPSIFPASFAQQRLWFLDQLEPGTAAYNLVRAFRVTGLLDGKALASALRAVVHRHESLRTVFQMSEGETKQVVLFDVELQMRIVDVTHLELRDREKAALRMASEEGKKPFDLTEGPLFRALLVRMDRDKHLLVLAMHHIITDGWSISTLFREIATSYEAFVDGREAQFPELPVQYSEFAQWQREYVSGELLAKQVMFWKDKLAGAQTVLDLPTDHPRPSTHSGYGATEELVLDSHVLAALKKLAHEEGATLFMVSMAAFQTLLWKYTGQESILVGTPTAGRSQVEVENVIGFFVNTLVFRADFSDQLTFRDLVRQIRSYALDAYAHQDVPFEKLVEELAPERSMDTTPLFQVMFTFQNIPKQIFEISGLELKELEFETGISKFDLSVELYEDRDFHCRFEYNSDLFERPTILKTLVHFRNVINAALKDPDAPVSHIDLMNAGERGQVLLEWNNTSVDYPRTLVHEAFELEAARKPGAVALSFKGNEWSYQEINERSNRLSHYLIKQQLGAGMLIGVCIERSPAMIVALLAILKIGASYVPLDPSYPEDRLAFMAEDAEVACVITQTKDKDRLPNAIQRVIVVDSDSESIGNESPENISIDQSGDARLYLLYTSGSSGRPKGVAGTHWGAMNRMRWMWERYPFEEGEVCCQKTNLGFVDSVWEIFGPLLAGVRSVILPAEVVRDPEELLQSLEEHGVTRMVLVPSLLRALLDHAPNLGERVPRLKLWSCSGEVLSGELAGRFRQAFPEARLLNIYGASEVAADVTWHEVGKEDGLGATVPIGKPISNTQIYVLDKKGQVVPVGVRGEIYVGGEQLALGYWKRPELTAERFVENGLAPERSKRLYRTGDLGRWRGDGELEYLGRVDGEVKLRGMRIELGEIETVLAGHGGVKEAAVELVEEGSSEARLVAYLTGVDGETLNARELRRHLRAKLPEHMVPARYVVVEEFPQLPSGKVNRRVLRTMVGTPLAEQGMVGPRTETEKVLVEIWKELLKVEEVGVDQNFFELGGHSLLVLQVMARIRRKFGLELAVRTVFEEPTIAGLATAVETAERQGLKSQTPILQRRPRPTPADPSSTRQALLAQLDKLSAEDVQSLLKRVQDGTLSDALAKGEQLQ